MPIFCAFDIGLTPEECHSGVEFILIPYWIYHALFARASYSNERNLGLFMTAAFSRQVIALNKVLHCLEGRRLD